MLNILYNQTHLKRSLILGISYVIIGSFSLFLNLQNHFLSGFIGLGIFYVVLYFWQKNRPYVQITDDAIIIDKGVTKKQIPLDQITSVKYFAGDYVVKTPLKEVTIDTNLLDKESLTDLQQFMHHYTGV